MFNQEQRNQPSFEDFLRIPLRNFNLAGIKLIILTESASTSILEWMHLILQQTSTFINLIFAFAPILCMNFADMLELTTWVVYTSFASNCVFKMVSMLWVRRTLQTVILNLRDIFPTTAKEQADYRVLAYYTQLRQYLRFLNNFHWTVSFMFILFPIMQSLMEYAYGWSKHQPFEYRLPYIFAYPFDPQRMWIYPLVYAGQISIGVTVSCYFLGTDMLMVACVHILNMQFGYLSWRIEQFRSHSVAGDLNELKMLIRRHNQLLHYSDRVNYAFNIPNLLNFILSAIIVCLIGLQVVAGSGIYDLLKFCAFLIASLLDVYIVSRFGTNLIEASSQVSEAFSSHAWYQADVRYQKMLPLAIARAQRPAQLTAYKFFVITNESFKTLITTSYQFFTLIKTRYDETNYN